VIRLLVIAILILVVARAFWRVVDGILDGARTKDDRRASSAVKLARDPVCGTFVAPGTALSLSAGGTTHYFCSEECRAKYRAA
jgi:YHS domain-containing protein